MGPDLSSLFGGLLSRCIRDEYVKDEDLLREEVLLILLGIGSSVLTVYGLSLLRVFV
jgi:hypothetical protein